MAKKKASNASNNKGIDIPRYIRSFGPDELFGLTFTQSQEEFERQIVFHRLNGKDEDVKVYVYKLDRIETISVDKPVVNIKEVKQCE